MTTRPGAPRPSGSRTQAPGHARIADGTGLSEREAWIRDRGTDLLVRLSALIRVGRAYSVGNQVFVHQLEALEEVLTPVLAEHGEAIFVAYDDGLYLNGVRVPTRGSNFRHYQDLVENFARRDIAGLRVATSAPIAELATFFDLYLKPDVYRGPAFLEACRAGGLVHVLPALFVRAEDSPEGEDGTDGTSEAGTGGAGETGGGNAVGAAASAAQDGAAIASESTPDGAPAATAARAGRRGAAPKGYASAVEQIRSLLTTTTLQEGLELKRAKRVVQPLVDAAGAAQPVLLGLAGLSRRDEFTFARNVNTVLIAVGIGHTLGLDRATLADLGVAALLHDVGLATTRDRTQAGVAGATLIARTGRWGQSTERAMQVAFEVGQPDAPPASLLTRIVAIADRYSTLVSHRGELGKRVTPTQALGMVLGPLAPRFDPALRAALVETLGFHPPGQLVELDTGELAVVLAPNREDLGRPILRLISGPHGRPLPEGDYWEGGPLPRDRSIRRALKAEEYPAAAEESEAA